MKTFQIVSIKNLKLEAKLMNENIKLQIEQIENKMDRLRTQKEFYEKLLKDRKATDEK